MAEHMAKHTLLARALAVVSILGICAAAFSLGTCAGPSSSHSTAPPTPTATEVPATIVVTSPAFAPNQAIPVKYSCHGENISPPLEWRGTPAQTVTLTLIVEDLTRGEFTHWVLFNVPAGTGNVPAGIPQEGQLVNGARQGTNSLGMIGYYGPCPAGRPGTTDEYHFTLYALDASLSLGAGASRQQVLAAAQPHMLAQGELIGTYSVA